MKTKKRKLNILTQINRESNPSCSHGRQTPSQLTHDVNCISLGKNNTRLVNVHVLDFDIVVLNIIGLNLGIETAL